MTPGDAWRATAQGASSDPAQFWDCGLALAMPASARTAVSQSSFASAGTWLSATLLHAKGSIHSIMRGPSYSQQLNEKKRKGSALQGSIAESKHIYKSHLAFLTGRRSKSFRISTPIAHVEWKSSMLLITSSRDIPWPNMATHKRS